MNIRKSWLCLLAVWPAIAVVSLIASPVQAQDDNDEVEIEEIVTTGSRIRRDAFSTTTPIQILDAEASARIGITSITELLQKATAASGEQIDGGISTNAGQTNASEAPPDGGVGSACINLRGLGCERTLVLVNGKRLGVSGIRGAPPQPDINMLPIGMVEGVDLLTGGLSTVYGADAVAGVVNVRLKKDFEGISFTVNSEIPGDEGGEIYAASMVAGIGTDSANFTFGMEYSRQERVRTGDRSFSQCLRRGTSGISQSPDGQRVLNCRSDFPDNWVITGADLFASGELATTDGSVPGSADLVRLIYTMDGGSNIGVPGFATFNYLPQTNSSTLEQFPSAGRAFALDRFRYADSLANDQLDRQQADLWRPYERFSLVMNGNMDLDWGANTNAYFEGYYFNRTNFIRGATEQIFPTILGMAPLVDATNTPILDANGAIQLVDNPLNPFSVDVSPIITLDDVPQTFDTELQQIRLVTGLTGDLGFSESWGFDVSASYDRGVGFVAQPVLLENNLFFATQNIGVVADPVTGLPTNEVVCDPRVTSSLNGLLTQPTCVPANLLAPSIAGDGVTSSGTFSSQAERDYLVQTRTNRTVTETMSLQAYAFGDLFELPAGSVGSAFGIEFRDDSINSQNSAIGVLGLNAAENPLQEGETRGSRTTFDVYGEISAPLIVDARMAELVQLDLAVRFTDDENFGNETVYKVGLLWNINEHLSASTSFNTSFRAPNLREQFLADQAGALPGGSDPCRQPSIALATPGPALDRLIANCILSGADVTVLGTNFTVAIPTTVGGAAGLTPETSDSLTATISASQPWTDRFDFDVALTYFDIQIEDTVRALDPGTIVARCFNDLPNLASPFCDRVERDRPNAPADQNFISFVRAGFVNTGEESAKGYDLTTRFLMDVGNVNVNWSTAMTIMKERLSQEFPPSDADLDGSAIINDVGRIGNPEYTFQSTLALTKDNWDVVWQTRWWDDTEFAQGLPNPVITDAAGLCLSGCPVGADPSMFFGDDGFTDYGFSNSSQIPDSFGVDGTTRPVTAAPGQWHHDLSLSYNFESASVTAGINNLTNEEPSLISQEAGPNRNNAVSSARYDLIGRSYFVRFVYQF